MPRSSSGSDEDEQPIGKPEGYSHGPLRRQPAARRSERPGSATSPIFNYPYDRTREALHQLAKAQKPDPCHGIKMRYSNPVTGDHAMPTMGTFIQLLPKGFHSSALSLHRCRASSSPSRGAGARGSATTVLEWGPKDIFVVPSWKPVVHEADEESVLFSFSDRPVQEKIGVWREDRGNA